MTQKVAANPIQTVFRKFQQIHIPKPISILAMVIFIVVLGVGLGVILVTPAGPLFSSIVAIAFYLVFVASNPIGGVSLWLVLYPFTETTVNISLGEGIPDLSPTRFVVAFLTAILLGQAATGQRRFPKITWLDVACFLFVIGVGISAITSYDPVGAFQSVLDLFLIPVLAYYAVKNLVRNEKELNIVFNTVLIIAFYSCFFVFNEWITGTVLLYDGDAATIYADSGIRILRSLWGGPHVFGTIFGFAVPLTFYKLAKSDNAFSKVFYTLLLMLFLAALVLTFKRAAWVSTLVSFIIIFPFFPAFRKIFVIGLIILAIPLAVFWQQLSSVEGVEQRVTGRVDTLNGRTYRWEAAIDLWKEKPITGWGFKNFDTVSQYGAVENFYLHILVSGGLLAFIPFLAITILTIYGSLQIYIRGPSLPNVFVNRELVAIFWGLFATWLVKAMTGAQAVAIINILLFVIIGAMIGSQGEQLSLYKNKSSQAREP